MEALIQAFWRILLLREGPQSLPTSSTLLWLALVLHCAIGFLHALFSMPVTVALFYALVSTLTTAAVVQGLLRLFQRQARYTQSLTALAGCEALLGLLLLPLSLLYSFGNGGDELQGLLGILSILLIGWNVALAAHIFRHALNVSTGLGFLYSVAYLIIAITLGDMVSAAGATG